MKEISLDILIKIFKKNFIKILIFSVVVMIVVASFTHFFIPKKYSSSVKFYVVNMNSEYDYTSSAVVSAVEYLINDYIAIIKSDYMLDKIVDELAKDGIPNVTNAQLNSMIVGAASTETSVFTVSVSSTDKELAYKVATILGEIAPKTVTEIAKSAVVTTDQMASTFAYVANQLSLNTKDGSMVTADDIRNVLVMANLGVGSKNDCITAISTPMLDTAHDSPNLPVLTLLGGILAAIALYVFYAIRTLTNQHITTEDDVKTLLKRPLLATVPHWEVEKRTEGGKNR